MSVPSNSTQSPGGETITPSQDSLRARARAVAAAVADPELPFLSIEDLGILRDVRLQGAQVVVSLSPTYSGCPAVQVIEESVTEALQAAGINATVERVLSPAWTTDWITAQGRQKLLENGIAPPAESSGQKPNSNASKLFEKSSLFEKKLVCCPNCNSDNTEMVSAFGSTPCKSLYRCCSCLEPFDYFKCL